MATTTQQTGRRAARPAERSTAAGRGSATRTTNQPAVAKKTPRPADNAGRAGRAGPSRKASPSRAAAERAARHNSTEFRIPLLGKVELPPSDELAYLGGVGLLAVVGAIEWPIAALLGAGHVLASSRRNKVVREFGEALDHG